ncbi:MAG: YabP/YqfC family sporulation protein [Clostridia bacterium]|nr:YabP/YqfC family sporulation protein [Clostridia bacterium]MBR7032004.1 YabP/YqfC family sporulation protein [Clostridia bacterium]
MNTESEKDHRATLISREYLDITGVVQVESYTDTSVVAASSLGTLSIEGEDIRIDSFSSETGRLVVRGKIDGFFYYGDGGEKKKRPRLFRGRAEN